MSISTDHDWRDVFLREFARLRSELDLHPAGRTPAAIFEGAAQTARTIGEECLPLGIGVVMHLYPLCASRCVPLQRWSRTNWLRSRLLGAIDKHKLILANAGSERAAEAHAPITVTHTRKGARVCGKFDYVSLANVADIVMFNAPLNDGTRTLFCAADLHGNSVHVGGSKFAGSMRLSDTCSVTFDDHLVPRGRYLVVPDQQALHCMAQYQRSWFQLLLGEGYLARIERLRRQWELERSSEQVASLNELALLRDYALRLLDAARPDNIEHLSRVTAAMKLRISWHAQSTAAALQGIDDTSASELRYFQRQPTSDERILRSLNACGTTRWSAAPAMSSA